MGRADDTLANVWPVTNPVDISDVPSFALLLLPPEIIQYIPGQAREVLLMGIAGVGKGPAVGITGGDNSASAQPVFNNVLGVMVRAGQYAASDFVRRAPSGMTDEFVDADLSSAADEGQESQFRTREDGMPPPFSFDMQ